MYGHKVLERLANKSLFCMNLIVMARDTILDFYFIACNLGDFFSNIWHQSKVRWLGFRFNIYYLKRIKFYFHIWWEKIISILIRYFWFNPYGENSLDISHTGCNAFLELAIMFFWSWLSQLSSYLAMICIRVMYWRYIWLFY